MSSLLSMTVREMREGLLRGDFTSLELAKTHLKRIAETNDNLNSFLCVCAERAEAQAVAADKRIKAEGAHSPLLTGIPIAVKDMIVTEGVKTTCASRMLKDFVPPYDATVIVRLQNSGAVILGKTNMDEFGMGSSNENSYFGPVKNAWDYSRVAGGTSGGSAVAVASGQAPIALGTDTGGSVRQPASFNGIVGLKPTYGRVSRYGVVAYASSFEQVGPMGKTVEDVAALLEVISGLDELDSTSMAVEVPKYSSALQASRGKGLAGVRIGVPKEYFLAGMNPEVEAAVKSSIETFRSLGAEIVDVSLPHADKALAVYYIIASAEASSNLARYDGVRYGFRAEGVESTLEMYERTRSEGFGKEAQRRIFIGTYVLSSGYYDAYYLKAQQVRTLMINDFKAAFTNSCDFILSPVSPTTAFPLGAKTATPMEMYLADIFTVTANIVGVPGISIPCGLDSDGLPIGVQLLGRPFDESGLLQAAYAFEQEIKFDSSRVVEK